MQRLADSLVATILLSIVALATCLFPSPSASAANPAPEKLESNTIAAFDRYVHLTDERNDSELKRGSALLWIDALPDAQRAEAYSALKRGEVQIHQLSTLDNGTPIDCPGGMIHHWVGVVFIPGAKLGD
ncbi:MAG: hypothetical protein WAO11_19315, partial [Candidatus Acidiferrum sp.]